MPPPTQGLTTLHILVQLEEQDISSLKPSSSEKYKVLLEKARVAYYIRDKYITDPRYMSIDPWSMLNHEFIEKNREECLRETNRWSDGDTTFYAIVDREGWIVAGIQSLFHPFGSYLTEPRYNITLNSRASSFSLDENHVNRLEPGKKTMHILSAIIVEDEDRVMAIGLSGGHYRPLLHAQLMVNLIDHGMDPQEAIKYPRIIWKLWGNVIEYEEGLDLSGLKDWKLVERPYPSRLGVAAITEIRSNGVKAGYTDIRGDGYPIGLA